MASPVEDVREAPPETAPPREVFWNLPNTVTLLRVLAVPALLAFPWVFTHTGSLVMAWIYIVAATTDLVDGWLARRGAQETRVGKLLDPLADKLVISTALIVLLAMGRIPLWGTWMTRMPASAASRRAASASPYPSSPPPS